MFHLTPIIAARWTKLQVFKLCTFDMRAAYSCMVCMPDMYAHNVYYTVCF